MQQLAVSAADRDGVCVVTVAGELDVLTSRDLDAELTRARRAYARVVLDLSGVGFMDTSSLAVIVGHWRNLEAAGGWLALAGARYQYLKSLWITGLADRIPLFESAEQAVTAAPAAGDRDA